MIWYNIEVKNIGMSPSGKALDFDSSTRQFKSGHPSQIPESLFSGIYFFTFHSSLFTNSGIWQGRVTFCCNVSDLFIMP